MKRSAANLIETALILAALFFVLAVMAALIAAPAHAQSVCGPRTQVIASITGVKYAELPMVELGSMDGTRVMHIYANPQTGTWTMVGFPDAATACLLATGKDLKMIHSPEPGMPL